MNRKLDELMAAVVERLVAAIDEAGSWEKPWRSLVTGAHRQAENNRPYQGINSVILWVEDLLAGWGDPRWATYKTWERIGAQVQTGEKGTRLVFWKPLYHCTTCKVRFGDDGEAASEHQAKTHGGEFGHLESAPILRWFTVFNAGQVEGAEPLDVAKPDPLGIQMVRAQRFVEATGVEIREHPSRAFFDPSRPEAIAVPGSGQFASEPQYWGTVLHELVHWSGHESRLDRQKGRMFGDEAYAGEELVAELGSAFLASHLGVETEPHIEHAAYLASWLSAVKAEPARLYHASKAAAEAVRYLVDLTDDGEIEEAA